MSKYKMRPHPSDGMVQRALQWIETSLVYEIPVMTEYSAFSRAMLTAAVAVYDSGDTIEITNDMVARSMQYLHESDVMKISALITYPHFVRELLSVALADAMPGRRTATIIPLADAPTT